MTPCESCGARLRPTTDHLAAAAIDARTYVFCSACGALNELAYIDQRLIAAKATNAMIRFKAAAPVQFLRGTP